MLIATQPPKSANYPGVPVADSFPEILAGWLAVQRLIAVVALERVEDAAPLADALRAGGIKVMELAWRHPDTLAAIPDIRKAAPDLILGMGTLLSAEQVRMARDAGVDFGVSPGASVEVIRASRAAGLPFAPGVQTPSDLHLAVEQGCRVLKFFPAETAGGAAHLRSLHAPFAHLGLRYIALGGLNEANAAEYLQEPSVLALGGSWIAPSALVRTRDWNAIRKRAVSACALVAGFSLSSI